eukprot:TRINITY_DN19540_c0_g1_i1.p1 TRINITY_DN19540_c0_g1~~TRINITY_DN19540_c0_g1_i1.p1  ORF type:complete len:131 (+),score=36.56 TRINITY_DN19540_c0_g1_i1:103-495(+)
MIRRPPRSTLSSSSAASDVYKRQMIKSIIHITLDILKDFMHQVVSPELWAVCIKIFEPTAKSTVNLTDMVYTIALLELDVETVLNVHLECTEGNQLAQEDYTHFVKLNTIAQHAKDKCCLLYTSPSPRDS